jgi:hypothetical protein
MVRVGWDGWQPACTSIGVRAGTIADLALEDGATCRAKWGWGKGHDGADYLAWWPEGWEPGRLLGVYDPIAWRPLAAGMGRERLEMPL